MTTDEIYEDIIVKLSDPQQALMDTRARLIFDCAGQGGGKSQNIGYHSGLMITTFPRAKGFIGANTYDQLNHATLKNCYDVWRTIYGLTEYSKENPHGSFVVDRKPPESFQKFMILRSYKNVISFRNGAIVFLGSLDNYSALDGKEFTWAHLDETKDTKEEAVKEVIIGRLRQRGLWVDAEGNLSFNDTLKNEEAIEKSLKGWTPLFIHTSPANGITTWINDWFNIAPDRSIILEKCLAKETDFYHKEDKAKQTCAIIYSAFHNKENLPPESLENKIVDLGYTRALKLVYGYPFAKSGGEWYPEYERLLVVKPTPYLPGKNILLSWDFNVMPYMTCLSAQIEFITRYIDELKNRHAEPAPGRTAIDVTHIRIFKEYCLASPNNTTERVCNKFKSEYTAGEFDVNYYGDASGRSQIPGLGSLTNYKIIEENLFEFLNSGSKKVKGQNISPSTRKDIMNDIFSGRLPFIEVSIDPSCLMLIKDCEEVLEGADGNKKKVYAKDENGTRYEYVGHTSDALEYLVCEIARPFVKISSN